MRGYGFTVLAEVLAILVGSRVLAGVFDLAEETLPWVATVVGVHFVLFARIFKESIFAVLGIPMTVCGVVGVAIAVSGVGRLPITIVGGIAPGVNMLAAVGWSAWTGRRAPAIPGQ